MGKREPRYTIPVGTKVEIQNLNTGDTARLHVTRKELSFMDRTNTGYDGQIFYFTYENWLIAVGAREVI